MAIHVDEGRGHSSNWALIWIEFCRSNNIFYEVVNCFSLKSIKCLEGFDLLLWHFSHYSVRDMAFSRSILVAAKSLGLRVFPDFPEFWHFDDKVAQSYCFEALGIDSPNSQVFYTYDDALTWINNKPDLPVVAKLRCGSGSQNVKMLSSREDFLHYAKNMFYGSGFSAVPSVAFKAKSNLFSVRSLGDFVSRLKRIPDFVDTLSKSRHLSREKGYMYVQEFVPNEGYDLKVVVVGDKLSFIARRSRGGDFRASGGGDLFFDKELVTPAIIDLCFEATDKLGSSCMGYDVVVSKASGRPYIIEMSYGFSFLALLSAKGYWRRDHVWIDEPLNAPMALIELKLQS